MWPAQLEIKRISIAGSKRFRKTLRSTDGLHLARSANSHAHLLGNGNGGEGGHLRGGRGQEAGGSRPAEKPLPSLGLKVPALQAAAWDAF